MNAFNYKMIEIARNSRSVSQKELATRLPKLNQSTISKIEHGDITPSSDDLSLIADALAYPVSFFFGEETKMPISHIYYRKRATLPQKIHEQILAEAHQVVLRSIDKLLEKIKLKIYPQYVFDVTDGWTPRDIAIRLREIMHIHPGKPVKDIIRLVEEMGVIVYFYDSPSDKFDGMTCYTNNGIPVIIVNKNFPPDRIKLTLMHELIHLVAHLPCIVEPWRVPENEAYEGALEFYMPRSDCYRDLQNLSYKKLGVLKSYWGISKAAIVRHARNLECINQETYVYLNIELGRRGERKTETGYVEVDRPQILDTSIRLLKNELGLSIEELAEMASLSVSDYSRLFESNNSNVVRLRVLN